MQAGDVEFCQSTLNLLTFSISGFPALRRELSGEEIDNSAWLRDHAQERAPVGSWKPPPCCCFFHSKVNNAWCHWCQGNWLLKLRLKTAKSVLLGTFWPQDCTVPSLLTNVYWMKKSVCLVWFFFLPPADQPVFWRVTSLWMLIRCSPAGYPLWRRLAEVSVMLQGSWTVWPLQIKTAVAVQHLLASGSATCADSTLANLLCCWCTKANSSRSSDINILLLAEWEGLVH